jgi:hypothetical protein
MTLECLTAAENEDMRKLAAASLHRGKRDPYRITLVTRKDVTMEQVAALLWPLLKDSQIAAWQIEGPGSRGVVAGGYPED